MSTLITCEHASFGYEGQPVIFDVNFKLEQGDYVCLLGENGSGKSSLMKGVLGLLKPMSGHVTYNIKENEIGYLPQQIILKKDFPATAYEVVISGCLAHIKGFPFYSKSDKAKVKENMEMLNIWNLAKKPYRDLSGGQQQRVLLARALCATGSILFLDEPQAGLDPIATSELYEVVAGLNKEKGLTVMMISHDMEAAFKYSTKIMHIDKSIAFFGPTEEYKQTDYAKKMLGGGANA